MARSAVLSDADWARLEPLLPSSAGVRGRPIRDHRQVLEGIVFRYRTGCAWRDLPAEFGPSQTVWKRHHRFSRDGTWDRILTALQAQVDAAGDLDWTVSVDSSISRVHQHGATAARTPDRPGTAPAGAKTEPAGRGLGRSRGGLSTKTHLAVDGRGRPLAVLLGVLTGQVVHAARRLIGG